MCKSASGLWSYFAAVAAIPILLPALAARAGPCRLERRKAHDGSERVTLRNKWLALEISPEKGGAVTSFVYLPTGEEMTSDKPDQTTLLTSLQGYRSQFWGVPYRLEVLAEKPEEVAVALHWTTRSEEAPLKFIQLRRTLRVLSGVSQVHVAVEFHNTAEQMMPVYPQQRFFNSTRFLDQAMNYYVPTEAGVREIPYELDMPTREIFEYQPSRGWMGCVSEKS